jgi:hypothetical protein
MFNADKNDTVRLPPHDVQHTSDSGPPPLVSPAVGGTMEIQQISKKYDANREPS